MSGARSLLAGHSIAKTARARIGAAASRATQIKQKPTGPTRERLGKGDIPDAKTAAGFYRALSPVESLYKVKKLGETREHVRDNYLLFQAAERLKHHFDRKNAIGIRAQDLTRVIGISTGTAEEESWVIHKKHFDTAMVMMGSGVRRLAHAGAGAGGGGGGAAAGAARDRGGLGRGVASLSQSQRTTLTIVAATATTTMPTTKIIRQSMAVACSFRYLEREGASGAA